jgi:hypothetical protein
MKKYLLWIKEKRLDVSLRLVNLQASRLESKQLMAKNGGTISQKKGVEPRFSRTAR